MTDELFRGVVPFVTVAERSSFREAARHLGVTPAAISKAVAALEEDLGVRLLDRTSRRVALTPEGQLFFERCRDAVANLRAGRELVSRAQRVPKGDLAVTLSFVLGPLLVRALPRFTSRYPAVRVRLHLEDRVSPLVDEGLDVALRLGALGTTSLVARRVRETRWVTVAEPGYLARRGEPKRPDDLAEHDCLKFVTPGGRPAEWAFLDDGRAATVAVPSTLLLDQGELLAEGARAGLGIAQVLDFMADGDLREGRLVEVLPSFSAVGPPVHVLYSEGRRRSPRVRAFVEFVLEELGARD